MKIREIIEALRVNKIIEIRKDNYIVITFEANGYENIKDELLDEQVYDWGTIDEDRIFINYKSEVTSDE